VQVPNAKNHLFIITPILEQIHAACRRECISTIIWSRSYTTLSIFHARFKIGNVDPLPALWMGWNSGCYCTILPLSRFYI